MDRICTKTDCVDVREGLDGGGEVIGSFGDERVERVPKSRLADELECCAPHPGQYIDFRRFGAVIYFILEGGHKLSRRWMIAQHPSGKALKAIRSSNSPYVPLD